MLQWLLALIPLRQVHKCHGDGVEAEICLERGHTNRVVVTVRSGGAPPEVSQWGWLELKLRLKTGWSPVPMPASQLERLMWKAEDKQSEVPVRLAAVLGGLALLVLLVLLWRTDGYGAYFLRYGVLFAVPYATGPLFKRALSQHHWEPFVTTTVGLTASGIAMGLLLDLDISRWWVLPLNGIPLAPIRTHWDGNWDPTSQDRGPMPAWRDHLHTILVLLAMGAFLWPPMIR